MYSLLSVMDDGQVLMMFARDTSNTLTRLDWSLTTTPPYLTVTDHWPENMDMSDNNYCKLWQLLSVVCVRTHANIHVNIIFMMCNVHVHYIWASQFADRAVLANALKYVYDINDHSGNCNY